MAPNGARVIVAEDDPKQAELIRTYLTAEGHAVVVVHDGVSALEQARQRRPDLMVLDVMMPGLDGLDVCRILRFETDIPIVFVTARATEDDMLAGLDLGADDYLTKPFSPRELMARVRTVLRRSGQGDVDLAPITIGDIVVDPRRHEVTREGHPVAVTPKEFAILHTMAADRGRAFSRRDLLEAAFGFDYDGLERTIDVHVAGLRKKLEVDPSRPRHVVTVYGVGYKVAD
ncbi:MAG: response regulator transcription factor [Acidimicrobiales bacterium]